jgi:hypothetical protein
MANTFKLIASSTVGSGGTASIDFSSIPQTYTDLMAVISLRGVNSAGPESYFAYASFNGLTTNRTYRRLEAYGGGVGSDSGSNYPVSVAGGTLTTANTFSSGTFYIPNYSSTTVNKSYSTEWASENNSTTAYDIGFIAGLWSATSAITSMSITLSGSNLAQYSTAYLYGIKNS